MITLLTDFGLSDYYVPAVKGVILSIYPEARIIDITHDLAAHDIQAAAFILGACYYNFPKGTVHLAVVDPGVGSSRRAIVVEAGGYYFVGPDNGVFSFVYSRESNPHVFHIINDRYFCKPVSATFHGRDVFAPVAANISSGAGPEEFGPEIEDYCRFQIPRPRRVSEFTETRSLIIGSVIHIDCFGNLVTNFSMVELKPGEISPSTKLYIGEREIERFNNYYAEGQLADCPESGELFAYLGSAGYWEIALWRRSAAEFLNACGGDEVTLLVESVQT